MIINYNYIPKDFRDKCSIHNIPEYMYGALYRYITYRIPPGGFLTAVICNDLMDAISKADGTNIHILKNYVQFLYNEAPSGCWGSRQIYNEWLAQK